MTDFTEPSGKCDVCKVRPATQWFGETSCATCDDPKCIEWMRKDYAEHLRTSYEIDGDDY